MTATDGRRCMTRQQLIADQERLAAPASGATGSVHSPSSSAARRRCCLQGSGQCAAGTIRRRPDAEQGAVAQYSLRVGSAQTLAADGASIAELQQAGGWKSPTTPGIYVRNEQAARGPVARRRYKVGS